MIRTLASITEEDEKFIEKIMLLSNAKTVLEFGCGISTIAISKLVDVVISYETERKFADKVLEEKPSLEIRIWDGKTIEDDWTYFDMAFVDGPAYGENRKYSTKIASEIAGIVIVHDAQREHEKVWQDKYLKDKFRLIDSNKMCNCWVMT